MHTAKTSFASCKHTCELEPSRAPCAFVGPVKRTYLVPPPEAAVCPRREGGRPQRAAPRPGRALGHGRGPAEGEVPPSRTDGSGRREGGRRDPRGPVAVPDSQTPGKAGAQGVGVGGREREEEKGGERGGTRKEARREEGGGGEEGGRSGEGGGGRIAEGQLACEIYLAAWVLGPLTSLL